MRVKGVHLFQITMPPRKNNRNKKDVSSDVQQKKRNDNDQLEKELINLFQKVQTGKISEKDGVSVLCRYYEKVCISMLTVSAVSKPNLFN